MSDALIGVTGATGAVGGRVAARLSDLGRPQRLVVRDAGRAPRLPGAQIRVASGYGAGDELQAALAGVSTLLLVSAGVSPSRADEHRTAIDAAVAAGVAHIVYLSLVGAAADATFTLARDHHDTEAHLRGCGVGHTILRENLYLNLLPDMVGSDGVLRGPAGHGRVAAVARDDVADAAVAVLTADRPVGGRHDLTGPEALTLGEAAACMARHAGRAITFHDEGVQEAFESRMDPDVPDVMIDAWVTSYLAIREGTFADVSDGVMQLTGRRPAGLDEVLARRPGRLDHVTATAVPGS